LKDCKILNEVAVFQTPLFYGVEDSSEQGVSQASKNVPLARPIVFSNAQIEESDEDKPDVILDYDKDGNIVGLEILDASKHMENPRSMEYAIAS